MTPPLRLAVIACGVLADEVRHYAAGLLHVREWFILPQGLHNEPERLRRELQAAVDRAEAKPDGEAIALVYGLVRSPDRPPGRRPFLVRATTPGYCLCRRRWREFVDGPAQR